MAKKKLTEYQKEIMKKIRQTEKIIDIIYDDCEKRGLNIHKVLEKAKVAKSTTDNWNRKNPKSFDNLTAIYEAMDSIEAFNKEVEKLKNKY
jgi:hypothetical protein